MIVSVGRRRLAGMSTDERATIRDCICPDKGMRWADPDCPYHEGIPVGAIQWNMHMPLNIIGAPLGAFR